MVKKKTGNSPPSRIKDLPKGDTKFGPRKPQEGIVKPPREMANQNNTANPQIK